MKTQLAATVIVVLGLVSAVGLAAEIKPVNIVVATASAPIATGFRHKHPHKQIVRAHRVQKHTVKQAASSAQ
ncbi:hypothetical protein [Vogesella sp. LIG4]|uniref:hypothetical protein n=1 Tax=Vogesella sp. LIG4 TaxID=1192162 RepID=UPI000B5AEF95|nr:hypothetical protein [Vogesella sp. LIG4]